MKKVSILIFGTLALGLNACKDDDDQPEVFKIRYVVVGEGVEEIKFNANDINYSVKKSFANGWDTTFTHTTKQKLQLQAKAKSSTSPDLTGYIFLNDNEVAKQIDDAKDTDGKFDVKLEYQIQ